MQSVESAPTGSDDETRQVDAATAFLGLHGIPAAAREFRLRQEFFRYGWDVRVVGGDRARSVRAVNAGWPEVEAEGTTEGNILRRALADAIGSDTAAASGE